MRRSHAHFGLLLAFALIILSAAAISAAPTDPYVEQFDAGGQSHLLRYTEQFASQAEAIKSAAAAIIPVYEKFWNTPAGGGTASMGFRLFIDVGAPNAAVSADPSGVRIQSVALPVASAPAVWTGQTETAKTSVCAVQLFSDAKIYTSAARVQFELALDLAQCYLLHYANPPANPPDWWFKGLTYWMAVQVYPPPPDVLTKLQKDYADNYNQDLTTAGAEALYFWEYVLGQGIPAAQKAGLPASLLDVTNGLKNLSGTPTFFTTALFYTYAHAVQEEQLEWQPKADGLAQDESATSLPSDVDLELDPNSIVLETLALPALDPDQGIIIHAENLVDNSVNTTILVDGQSAFALSDTSDVQVCNPPQSLTIIAGRGSSVATADAGLTVTKVEHCGPAATPDISYVDVPACAVGTWNVSFPFMEQTTQFTAGTWQYRFDTDGSLTIAMDGLTMKNKANLDIVMTYTVSGTVALQADASTPDRYNITQWNSQLDPGGTVVENTSDGMQIDISMALQAMDQQLNSPPTYLTCASDDAGNTTVNIYATDGSAVYDYILTRAS